MDLKKALNRIKNKIPFGSDFELAGDGLNPKYDALKDEAIQVLIEDQEKITPEAILSIQEGLACDRGIIPPHWNGWIDCEGCNCLMIYGSSYQGKKVPNCRWCHTKFKGSKNWPTVEDPRWMGTCAMTQAGKARAEESIPFKDAQDSEWYLEENIQQLTPDEDLEGFL